MSYARKIMDNGEPERRDRASKLVLASASPRRAGLLSSMGVEFDVVESFADESFPSGAGPEEAALTAARAKADRVARDAGAGRAVLAADTVVALDGAIFGKPADAKEARAMLEKLSGREHLVVTAVVLIRGGRARETVSRTKVRFAEISRREIDWYVATNEPFDKAGAYGIQGRAAGFVESVEGSYTNVVGLPLAETLKMLEEEGLVPWSS